VRLCNGKLEEKKSFYKATPNEMSKRIMGVKKNAEHNYMETEEKYCYVLPWSWKVEKDENNNVVENEYAMECRKAYKEEKEEE